MRSESILSKFGTNPKPSKGFYNAISDLKPQKSFVVYSENENYPISENVEAIGLFGITELLRSI